MGVPPELPTSCGQDNLPPVGQMEHPPPHLSEDDSDPEAMNPYDGYEPLAMEPDDSQSLQLVEQAEAEQTSEDDHQFPEDMCPNNSNLPDVESVDAEVFRNVWNAPRPQELQIELDTTQTNQILNVMANITLPNACVPEWAAGVPEEQWKVELLDRIRQRKPENK